MDERVVVSAGAVPQAARLSAMTRTSSIEIMFFMLFVLLFIIKVPKN